jgi:hypothetical protein
MFRHGLGNSNRPDERATPSGRKGNTIPTLFRFPGGFLHMSQCFYHNSLLEYRIETKLVSLESLEKMIQLEHPDGQ